MTLRSFCPETADAHAKAKMLTFFGAMLFSRGVSGTRYLNCPSDAVHTLVLAHKWLTSLLLTTYNRVVSCFDSKAIGGYTFESYGAHFDHFPVAYLTFACAIGMTKEEIDQLVKKLRKTIAEWKAKHGSSAIAQTKED